MTANDENCFAVDHNEMMQESADLFNFVFGWEIARAADDQINSSELTKLLRRPGADQIQRAIVGKEACQAVERCNGRWGLFILDAGGRRSFKRGGGSTSLPR
jgi:hypothetical protein